jgi:DNA-binding NtrC family response regulator/HAMP domain-containing protein
VSRVGRVLLLLAIPALAQDPVTVIGCPRTEVPPIVDGSPADPIWRESPPHRIGGINHVHPEYRQGWTGDDDLSADVRVAVSGEDLYLLFEVQDDTVLHEPNRSWWCGDSIELFLDTDRQSEEDDRSYSSDDFQIFLMPFNTQRRWGVFARGPEQPYADAGLRGLEVAHRRVDGGYVVESRIPLWNFDRLRPDGNGCIGFDVALNDVDEPGSTKPQTYLTLSGHFDLHAVPRNFARLAIGAAPPPPPPPPVEAPRLVDWTGLALGLAGVALLALLARRLVRRIARRTRVRAATAALGFLLAAALCALLPTLAAFLDARAARDAWAGTAKELEAAAAACLDLDSGDADGRAERLLALFRDGQVAIRPKYAYRCLPVGPAARQGPATAQGVGPVHYGIALQPGEARKFPLLGIPAPSRLRVDLSLPQLEERAPADRPAAEVRFEFRSGPPLDKTAAITPRPLVSFDMAEREGEPLRELVVRNRLPSLPLLVDALYAEDDRRAWSPLPLAAVSRSGVPLDVWQGRPATHLLPVPRGGVARIDGAGATGHRLWLALQCDGAYPTTPYGADAVAVRVTYAGGAAGPELRVVNGRDLESRLLATTRDPETIALQWEDASRQPMLYTLHALDLDPGQPLASVEVSDLGVLPSVAVAAVTVGRRTAEAPPPAPGIKLEGSRLALRDDLRTRCAELGFAVRSPGGATRAAGPSGGVPLAFDLAFGQGERGRLELLLPRAPWADTAVRYEASFAGGAALLGALAGVVAGATLLARARRLRVKMLAALTAATVVPLVFLVVALTRILNTGAEEELRDATLAALEKAEERIAARKAYARDLALEAADLLELVPAGEAETMQRHVRHSREDIEAKGAFLRLPELDVAGPSPLGNISFFDALARPGLYWSPSDGLVAVGVERTSSQHRCIVGLPAGQLVTDAPPGVTVVISSPAGDALAASGGRTTRLRDAAARQRGRSRYEEALRIGRPVYEPAATFLDERVAAAHSVLREEGRPLALLGVHLSRAATDNARAATLRTLLLSTLAALLLVVIAGGTLVDRVTHRLQRLTRATRAIAAGDLGNRAPIEEEDEVGRLASSFNTMADALDERVRQLTELHRGLHELTAALDRTEVARVACSVLARATGTPSVQVAVLDAAGEGLQLLHRRGDAAPLGTRLPADGPARDAVELKRAVVREGGAYLPLIAGGRAIGLAVCSPVDRDREPDRAFLDASGRQIGIALENARLYTAAVTDELTGLYTMPFFVRRLKEEVDRAAATGRPLSLLRVVIADLRGVARRRGAAAAARAVAAAAAALEEALPRRNMLARGESGELLALLVESDAQAARRLRDQVAVGLRRRADAFAEAPEFSFRTVSYPQDGAAADMLLDSLFEATETWEESRGEPAPALRIPPDSGFVASRSPTMRAALEVVARVAPTNATVLLSGETGAGKELLADLIHANGDRAQAPYVRVNCAAIPDTLVESELFGYERGAFTGAERRHTGRFETANKGTLFLDEVGELPLPTQAKLLRVLQERRITRVGGAEPVDIDVRIIAASNRDLSEAVRRGEFREDLYHRLHVIELRVPPLRERREDIPELIDHFRRLFNAAHGLHVEAFAPDALDALYQHPWPGNVRELKNVVERTMLMAEGSTVEGSRLALPAAPAARPAPAVVDGLTPRQERILVLARERGGITNGEIVKEEEVSARTALREVQRLVDRGLLVRVGRRRGAVYRPGEKVA